MKPPIEHSAAEHRSPTRGGAQDDLGRAAVFVLSAVMILPMISACAKYLADYSVFQVTWARYAGHFAFMLLIFVPRSGLSILRSSRLKQQLARSTLHCAAAIMFFYAIRFVSLPTATSINFTAPLMVAALAPFVLGERVSGAQWIAVLVGFVGALVVIRPGAAEQHWALIIVLLNAVASAVVQIMSRQLARHDGAATSNIYMVLVGFVLMTLVLPFVWRTPENMVDVGVFLMAGVSGGLGHYLLVRAFELAPAAFVSPFTYGQLLGATLISALVFDQLPDVWTWVGAAIIVGSGLFLLMRSRRKTSGS